MKSEIVWSVEQLSTANTWHSSSPESLMLDKHLAKNVEELNEGITTTTFNLESSKNKWGHTQFPITKLSIRMKRLKNYAQHKKMNFFKLFTL